MKVAFDILQTKLWAAYGNARKNKRNTVNQLRFEIEQEANLLQLAEELDARTYRPGKSVAFVVSKPVKREIFAAGTTGQIIQIGHTTARLSR